MLPKFEFIKEEILAQLFSCEFCEISKNIFSYRTPLGAVSESLKHVIDFAEICHGQLDTQPNLNIICTSQVHPIRAVRPLRCFFLFTTPKMNEYSINICLFIYLFDNGMACQTLMSLHLKKIRKFAD